MSYIYIHGIIFILCLNERIDINIYAKHINYYLYFIQRLNLYLNSIPAKVKCKIWASKYIYTHVYIISNDKLSPFFLKSETLSIVRSVNGNAQHRHKINKQNSQTNNLLDGGGGRGVCSHDNLLRIIL